MRWRALKIYLITSEGGFTKVQFRKSTNDRAKPWTPLWAQLQVGGGATRGARLAGAVLFDPAPGGGSTEGIYGQYKVETAPR
jgi:hypothetical protein